MLGLFLGEAVLGGISVLVKLAWVSVMSHFLLAIALVTVALPIHKRASEPDGPRVSGRRPAAVRSSCASSTSSRSGCWCSGTLVTAAGPHGGDVEAKRLSWPDHRSRARARASVDVLVVLVLVLVVVARARSRAAPRAHDAVGRARRDGRAGHPRLRAVLQGVPALLVGFHVPARSSCSAPCNGSSSSCAYPSIRSPRDRRRRASSSSPDRTASGPFGPRRVQTRSDDGHGCLGTTRAARLPLCRSTSSTAPTSCSASTSRRAPATSTPTASRSAATRAVVGSVLGMLEDGATHLGVATDHVDRVVPQRPLGRLQDGRRASTRAVRQFPLLEDALDALGRRGVGDGRARSRRRARRARPRGRRRRPRVEQVIICTPDKDLGQCVGGKVVQLDRRKEILLDADGVHEKFGVAARVDPRLARARRRQRRRLPRPARASARRRRPRCSRATTTSRRSPTTATAWDVPGVRGVDRLAATLAAGRDVADRVQGARDAAHRRRRRRRSTTGSGPGRPPDFARGASGSARRDSLDARRAAGAKRGGSS